MLFDIRSALADETKPTPQPAPTPAPAEPAPSPPAPTPEIPAPGGQELPTLPDESLFALKRSA